MSPRLRLILLSSAFRWTVLLLVLLVAGVIALWPRAQQTAAVYRPTPPVTQPEPAGSAPPCPQPVGGAAAPEFGGVSVSCLADGKRLDAAQVLAGQAGRPTLINVWASWCPPCRDELPVLQRYAERDDAARVVGLQIDSAAEDGRALLGTLDVRLPMLYDPDEVIARKLGVPYGLPASYLVNERGEVRFIANPRVFETVADVEQAVRRYAGTTGNG